MRQEACGIEQLVISLKIAIMQMHKKAKCSFAQVSVNVTLLGSQLAVCNLNNVICNTFLVNNGLVFFFFKLRKTKLYSVQL